LLSATLVSLRVGLVYLISEWKEQKLISCNGCEATARLSKPGKQEQSSKLQLFFSYMQENAK